MQILFEKCLNRFRVWWHKEAGFDACYREHAHYTQPNKAKSDMPFACRYTAGSWVPNQTRKLLQTPHAADFKGRTAEWPHRGSKCPIFTSLSSLFSCSELNLPYSNLAQELQLPSWVFSISKKNKQLISNFMVLYFRWFWKLFNLLSPGTVAETKRHQTTLVCLSLIYKLHWCFDSHEVGMWGNLHSTTAAALETLNSYPTRFHNQKQSWTRV